MQNFFARRTSWNLTTNRYTDALAAHRHAGKELLDLTTSNPTIIGLQYRADELLRALANPEALHYDPQPKGLPAARAAVAAYYAEHGSLISSHDLLLTTSTSEAYSFVFRLLCDPGDAVLVPMPSYPLFDFLADIQDVKLLPYELVYDHGWQIDFASLGDVLQRANTAGQRCRAVLVVHPNNPTGSYVKPHEAAELNRLCAENSLTIIADEVFLDYSMSGERPLAFSANHDVLTFTLNGLSKSCALPQMKVAWIAVSGPPKLKQEALARLEVIADTYLSMNAPVQLAIPVMLQQRQDIQQQLLARIRENLRELDSQLAQQALCKRLVVEAGWYAVVRVPAITSDEEFAIALLQQRGVLVQPGHFYDFSAEGYLVVSLMTPPEVFQQGLNRLLEYVATAGSRTTSV
jgi:aspartate/methionine/tyrosine aminotransferase